MLQEKAKDYFQRYNDLKVLFYFDENKEFLDEINDWTKEEIVVVKADHTLFNIKHELENKLANKKVLLYFTTPEPKGRELLHFPLTDLLYANKILKIDDVAEFMEMYGLKSYQRPIVKKYIKYIKLKKTQSVLATVLTSLNFEEGALKKGLISSFLGFTRIESETLIIAKLLSLLLQEDNKELNQVIDKLQQIDSIEIACRLLDEYFEINTDVITKEILLTALKKLKYSVIMQNISRISPNDNYSHLKVSSANKLNLLNSLILDWQTDAKLSKFIKPLFMEVASDVKEDELIKIYGIENDYGYYSYNLATAILHNIIDTLQYQPEKSLTILNTIKSNIDSTVADISQITRLLIIISNVYKELNNIKSYVLDKEEYYIEKYTNEYYRIDYYYRKFILILGNAKNHELYDTLELDNICEEVSAKYEDHIKKLNSEWLKCLDEHNFQFESINTHKQYDFYQDNITGSENKIAVIISDALRYEAAYELMSKMHSDPQNQASISSMLTSLPSNTKLGMANLLPHKSLEFDGTTFSNDGITIEGLANREKILQNTNSDSRVISFNELTKLPRVELREIFKSSIVYVYHNTIDAIGDDRKTESQTFDAVEQAIKELVPMIRKIHSSYNVTDLIITTDHGFIYNHKTLSESMYEPLPDNKSAVINHNRFSIIKNSVATNSYVIDFNKCANVKSDYKITIPKAINRYKRQGHGVHYVHGGASLQEMIVPVIKSIRKRQDVIERVTFRLVSKQLKIVSGALKVRIVQDKPIGSDLKPVTLLIGLYDDSNTLVSNEKEVILDSTSSQPTDRIFETILNLDNEASKLNFVTLKAFDKEKEKDKLNPSISEKVVNQTLIQTDF